MNQTAAIAGQMFRSWRMSQLDLALRAQVSQKHVSFVESGRAAPSRDMILHLAKALDVPLRERNALLNAAGFAPIFRDRPLDDPSLAPALENIERLLKAHLPYPALTVDRHWNLVASNAAVAPLLVGADPRLMEPPVNVMRLSLHPRGLAPLIVNLPEWRAHLLERLRRQALLTADRAIEALLAECEGYGVKTARRAEAGKVDEIAVPLRLRTLGGVLSFLSTVIVFGTAVDLSLAELSLEAFYPADDATLRAFQDGGEFAQRRADSRSSAGVYPRTDV
jgi:transcriptional regulator with XRE-family HTH domain